MEEKYRFPNPNHNDLSYDKKSRLLIILKITSSLVMVEAAVLVNGMDEVPEDVWGAEV